MNTRPILSHRVKSIFITMSSRFGKVPSQRRALLRTCIPSFGVHARERARHLCARAPRKWNGYTKVKLGKEKTSLQEHKLCTFGALHISLGWHKLPGVVHHQARVIIHRAREVRQLQRPTRRD